MYVCSPIRGCVQIRMYIRVNGCIYTYMIIYVDVYIHIYTRMIVHMDVCI